MAAAQTLEEQVGHWLADVDAAERLYLRGLLTDAEARKVSRRLKARQPPAPKEVWHQLRQPDEPPADRRTEPGC